MVTQTKIHIMGGPGSGKSYMAEGVAELLGCPHIDLDTLCWNGDFSQRLEKPARQDRLREVVDGGSWVVEGAYCGDWLRPSFEAADSILQLQVPSALQYARLARRLGGRLLRGRTDLARASDLMRWVSGYEEALHSFPEAYQDKVVPIIGKAGVRGYLASLNEATG